MLSSWYVPVRQQCGKISNISPDVTHLQSFLKHVKALPKYQKIPGGKKMNRAERIGSWLDLVYRTGHNIGLVD